MAWWEPHIPDGEPKGLELTFYIGVVVVGIIGLLAGIAALAGLI